MRKPLAVLAATATFLGVSSVAPAHAAPPPSINKAWIAVDAGRIGILDAGDVLKLRFSRSVTIPDITSFAIGITGANGIRMPLENEVAPYGGAASTKGSTLTMVVNLIPEEYVIEPPTYPLTVHNVHAAAKGGDHAWVSVPGSRDVLID